MNYGDNPGNDSEMQLVKFIMKYKTGVQEATRLREATRKISVIDYFLYLFFSLFLFTYSIIRLFINLFVPLFIKLFTYMFINYFRLLFVWLFVLCFRKKMNIQLSINILFKIFMDYSYIPLATPKSWLISLSFLSLIYIGVKIVIHSTIHLKWGKAVHQLHTCWRNHYPVASLCNALPPPLRAYCSPCPPCEGHKRRQAYFTNYLWFGASFPRRDTRRI